MTQENIIKILAGMNSAARKAGEAVKESSSQYIEDNVIKGNYVSREEYNQLHKLVIKLSKEVAELKSYKAT
ncbi:MAG: hypothetical protein COA94_05435 [Rickettsiales bacterium]|nr:MAG: hypothetical protein COA94_05435 [Rickettsiales bacterium]